VRGIVVHAASHAARFFYLHIGFEPSPLDEHTLLLRLSDVVAGGSGGTDLVSMPPDP